MSDDHQFATRDRIEVVTDPVGNQYIKSRTCRRRNPETGLLEEITINSPVPDQVCADPFDLHDYVSIIIGHNGKVTDNGTVLCDSCRRKNKWKRIWKLLFYPLYNPKIY